MERRALKSQPATQLPRGLPNWLVQKFAAEAVNEYGSLATAQRILVTGNAGSGKTTFATELAQQLQLPYFTLDTIVWQPRWRKTGTVEKAERIAELIERDCWVIDGVSDTVLAVADVVVFLDVARRVSAWRVARRSVRYLFRSRPGLPRHCPEILVIPRLGRLIWDFRNNVRPKLLAAQRQRGATNFVHIRWREGDH